MLFEYLLILGSLTIFTFPTYAFIKQLAFKDPVKEAEQRLIIAKRDAEIARLNKETEKVYQDLYDETLEESEEKRRKL